MLIILLEFYQTSMCWGFYKFSPRQGPRIPLLTQTICHQFKGDLQLNAVHSHKRLFAQFPFTTPSIGHQLATGAGHTVIKAGNMLLQSILEDE